MAEHRADCPQCRHRGLTGWPSNEFHRRREERVDSWLKFGTAGLVTLGLIVLLVLVALVNCTGSAS